MQHIARDRERTQETRKLVCGGIDDFSQKDGSRSEDGNPVNANWNDDKFKVNNLNLDNANDNYSVRSEVSHLTPPKGGFCVWLYLSQPLVIFEISCSFDSTVK